MDQSLLAAPHGFSQRATSFIASWCQGIHRMPFCRSIFQFSPQTGMIEQTRSVTHHAQEPFIRFLIPKSSKPAAARNDNAFQFNSWRQNPMMYDCAGRSFIMLLNTRNSCNLWQQARTHQPWSDNPIAKTRTNFRAHHSRGEAKTGTRIQTHQNLFTLTKNISAPQH